MAECLAGRRLRKNEHIDHIDQDPYNNTLSNLRIVSRSANRLNTDKSRGFFAYETKTKGTVYQVWFRSVYQGQYDTEEEAKQVHEALRQAALEAELDGVITLQQMIEEVA